MCHILSILLTIEVFKAYIVGGCIRDAILGKVPADWDVATDAQPEDVKLIFDKIVETGIKHGTVTAVIINGCNYEITTFRAPSSAKIPTIKDDLGLRDFYNKRNGLPS